MYQNMYRAVDYSLVDDLVKAINGEYSAIYCYGQLAEMAPTQEERNRINEIRQDEIRHYQSISTVYMHITGRQPNPQIVEQCAATYKAGLRASFIDEQETVDFYLDIAEKSSDPHVKELFKRAASDEQNHAVWFLFLLTTSS